MPRPEIEAVKQSVHRVQEQAGNIQRGIEEHRGKVTPTVGDAKLAASLFWSTVRDLGSVYLHRLPPSAQSPQQHRRHPR